MACIIVLIGKNTMPVDWNTDCCVLIAIKVFHLYNNLDISTFSCGTECETGKLLNITFRAPQYMNLDETANNGAVVKKWDLIFITKKYQRYMLEIKETKVYIIFAPHYFFSFIDNIESFIKQISIWKAAYTYKCDIRFFRIK